MSRSDKGSTYFDRNRAWWDSVVPVHEASRGYNREGFLRGEKSLCPVELAELGPHVAGKRLLHLQCHFGMDTLNWARLGATVTGLDFSEPAIDAARRLSIDSGIPGRFVQANVYDASSAVNGETFDIVYTGIGALCWLPDIRAWAHVVASCLEDGGMLYLYEGHPVLWSLNYDRNDDLLVMTEPYFECNEPSVYEDDETYVDGPKLEALPTCIWNHGLGEIVTALIDAGLAIGYVHEHRELPWRALPTMLPVGEGTPGADGAYQGNRLWRMPDAQSDLVPLMYSVMAVKS